MLDTVWVFAEAQDGKVKTITLEMLAKARTIASTVECFYAGDGDDVAEELGAHGCETVHATGDLGQALIGVPLAAALAAKIDDGDGPDLVLLGTTYDGRDVAGRLSARLGAPVITNVMDVEVDGDEVIGTESIFGGTLNVRTKFTSDTTRIVLVRPKSFAAEESGGGEADVEDLDVPDDLGRTNEAVMVERHVEETSGPKLEEAPIVVSGGRGLGDAEKYSMIEALAKSLKAAPGASRAIVDAGWAPYSYQVGQTGKVVKPNVYIACGISGATQHMVGMKGSKYIIAINKDQEAPIFSIADLGIVGDVHKVLPQLIEALQGR